MAMSGKVTTAAARAHLSRWRSGLAVLVWLAVILGAVIFARRVLIPAEGQLTHGFAAYYTASRLLLRGQADARLYDNAWFDAQTRLMMNGEAGDIYNVNPPSTAWMMIGLAGLSPYAARLGWTLANLGLLVATLALLSWEVGLGWAGSGLLTLIALSFTPLMENFRLGQAYALVLLLYTLALMGFLRGQDWLSGLSLALLLTLKSAGWPLFLLLILYRRWHALGFALAGVAFIVLGGLPWLGPDAWRAYLMALPAVGREPWSAVIPYQTTNSLWQHLFRYDPQWNPGPVADLPGLAAGLVALTAIAALALTLWAVRRGRAGDPAGLSSSERSLAFAAFVTLAVLLEPVGEQYHHTVLLLPLAVLLAYLGRQAVSSAFSPFPSLTKGEEKGERGVVGRNRLLPGAILALALLVLPFDLGHATAIGWAALLAYPRVYGTWLLWGVLIVALARAGREPSPPDPLSPTGLKPGTGGRGAGGEGGLLLGLFLAALALRLAFVIHYRFDGLYGQDAFEYFKYGRELWQTQGRVPLPGRVYWPLGYPYLMALSFLVTGVRPLGGQLVSLLAGSAVVPLTVLLARDLLVRSGLERAAALRAGRVAGVLALVCGQLVQSSLVVMSDAPGVFWATLSAWALVRAEGTRRPPWLVLAACALAVAVMTRWENGLLILPWSLYWLFDLRGSFSRTGHVPAQAGKALSSAPQTMASVAIALAAAGLVLVPQAVQSIADPGSSVGHAWLQGWSLANALLRDFVNADGIFHYRWPVALAYAQPAFHPFFLFPIFTPALLIGLWILWRGATVWRRLVGAALLLIGWPLAQYTFLAGIPYENARFGLAFFPPLAILVGLGADALWAAAPRWGRAVLVLAGAIGLAGALWWGWRTTLNSPIGLKQADLDTVAWVQSRVAADSRVLAFGLTATLEFYTPLTVREFFNETPETLAALLADGRPTYLILNVDSVEAQWQGRAPQINLHWLRDKPGLEEIGQRNGYTLYRVLQQ